MRPRGGADDFLDRLDGVPKPSPVLVRAEPPEGALCPALAVVAEVAVEPLHELLRAHARPVPVVEELVLEPPEEPLAGGVVRAAALGRHTPHQPVLLADPYPLGPAVVAAAVRVDDGARTLAPLRQGLEQRGVRQRLAGAPVNRPGRGPAVEAVDDGAQVDLLPGGEPELRDVGEPQLVGRRGVEVPGHEVGRGRRNLALVGVPAAPAPPVVDDLEALLAHHAHTRLSLARVPAARSRAQTAR